MENQYNQNKGVTLTSMKLKIRCHKRDKCDVGPKQSSWRPLILVCSMTSLFISVGNTNRTEGAKGLWRMLYTNMEINHCSEYLLSNDLICSNVIQKNILARASQEWVNDNNLSRHIVLRERYRPNLNVGISSFDYWNTSENRSEGGGSGLNLIGRSMICHAFCEAHCRKYDRLWEKSTATHPIIVCAEIGGLRR